MRAVIVHVSDEELAHRRLTGIDRYDEMWEGVLHMAPAPMYEHQRIVDEMRVFLKPLCQRQGRGVLATQIFDQDGKYIDQWRQFGRPSEISITRDDTIYVTDSESGPDTGARELPGIKKGIRIGSARDGRVTAFIEDMESTTADNSGAKGVGVDANGNVYGAVVRRQMLERHVR